MKNLFWLIFISILFVGCKKFLKEEPVDRFVVGNFYKSSDDAISAVTACYNQLYIIYQRNIILLNDLPTDDEKNGIGMPNQFLQDLEYLRYNSGNTFVTGMWANNYAGIARTNSTIDNISKINMDDGLKKRLIGEASFLRGLFYFNLVRFYGDVPLILHLESLSDATIPRNSKEDIYNQIILDLQYAESTLPNTVDAKDIGRATAGAAKILLGKVYLNMHRYQDCADKLKEVIDNEGVFGYGLYTDFKDNWRVSTKNGKEMVFTLEIPGPPGFFQDLMGLQGPKYSLPGGALPGYVGSNEADIPTMDLYSIFLPEDKRKAVTFKQDYFDLYDGNTYHSSIPLFGKYWEDDQPIISNASTNIHIIRYSDALLMYAEALNELGMPDNGLQYLNRVRERAFGDASHNYSALSQSDFREKVYLERRLELAGEGQRWFDLVRTDRLFETMKAHGELEASLAEQNKIDITQNAKEYQSLYPIPQSELDVNKLLTQNPGW